MTHPSHPAVEQMERLTHELRVHQVELETQNEELRRMQSDLAAARDRYLDLFEFAPVGYLTLDKDGVVVDCNLASARMLGMQRSALKGCRLSRFITPPDADRWYLYLRSVLQEESPQRIEIALRRGDQSGHWFGQIDSQRVTAPDQPVMLRMSVTDISGRMQADAERRIAAIDADEREVERQRVALQLHEDLGQRLSALKMDLSKLSSDPSEAGNGAQLNDMLASLDDAMSTVRRITMDLRPPMLDDLGLVAAIDWMVRDTAQRLGVPFTLSLCSEPEELGEHTRLGVYRFVQEAMTLLVHDTGGTHLHVGLRRSRDRFDLLLRARIQAWTGQVAHVLDPLGASILEYRARLLGGLLTIDEPRIHSGWIGIALSLPRVPAVSAEPSTDAS